MCGDHPEQLPADRVHVDAARGAHRPSRRQVLGAGAALAAGAALGTRRVTRVAAAPAGVDVAAVDVAPGLSILPREAWGADLPPRGPTYPEDSRFLLVHHSDSPTPGPATSSREVVRSVYAYQTGPVKGWIDVCYEFFIDPTGQVWEGRAGSLAGPVIADASQGSQGFAQLVCLLGTYSVLPPSAAMYDSLVSVLGWLARRDGIPVGPAATTSFVSRGSDKWKAGTPITTNTIAGHRDMTYTECPGNAMYALIPQLRLDVVARQAQWDALAAPHASPSGLVPAHRLGRVRTP